jgi:hypothetical protein
MMMDIEIIWFFKLIGSDELVVVEKSNLKTFLEMVELYSEPHDDSYVGLAMTLFPAIIFSGNVFCWMVLVGWTSVMFGSMLLASFDLFGGGVKVIVSMLSGDGGGLLFNINRWCGQIGFGFISAGDLVSVTMEVDLFGGKVILVDFVNEE